MSKAEDVMMRILRNTKTIAVVGLSARKTRAGYYVPAYLQGQGYRIIPVNPYLEQALGENAYPDLLAIPEEEQVDLVEIFRRPEHIPPIVEQAVQIGAKAIWMQLGITNQEAADIARAGGLDVIMDACMLVEHRRLASTGALD